MKFLKILIIMVVTVTSCSLFAWWDLGHFLTARVAQINLSRVAEKKVEDCLNYTIKYPPAPRRDFKQPKNMVNSATWLDGIKGGQWNLDSKDKDKFSNIHFSSMYYDVDSEVDNLEVAKEKVLVERVLTKYNSLQATESSIKSLVKPGTSKVEQAVALRTLIHLLGDIHCPMHSIDPTIDDIGTWGGNGIYLDGDKIKFEDLNGELTNITNMHKLWDGMGAAYKNVPYPVTEINYDYLDEIANELNQSFKDETSADVNLWAAKTLILGEMASTSQEVDYRRLRLKDEKDFDIIKKWEGEYSLFAKNISKQQVYLGGKRLGGILMAIYDPDNAQPKYKQLVNKIRDDKKIPTLEEYMNFKFR